MLIDVVVNYKAVDALHELNTSEEIVAYMNLLLKKSGFFVSLNKYEEEQDELWEQYISETGW